jgi:hypothetical protein
MADNDDISDLMSENKSIISNRAKQERKKAKDDLKQLSQTNSNSNVQ